MKGDIVAADTRTVTMRTRGAGTQPLVAWVDAHGDLHMSNEGAGRGAVMESDDGEGGWRETVVAADVPDVVALLGGDPGTDVLDLIEEHWTGRASHDFQDRLRDSDIDVDRYDP